MPIIAAGVWDTKADVKKAAVKAMQAGCDSVDNRDIKPFVPALISATQNPDEVAETVHKLSATVFVQSVDSPALSITIPILLRGCQEKKTEIKRKVAVIVDNMSKLIDDSREAKPFLPELMPEIQRLEKEMSDPEARTVAAKAIKTLQKIQDQIDQESATKSMSPDVVLAACLEVVSATMPSAPVTDPTFNAYLEYIATICSGLVNDLFFDEFEWKFVAVCPYLAPFMAEEDAVNICKNLLARCYRDAMPKEHAEDEDEDGEDLCNCEFSLGYGAKVRTLIFPHCCIIICSLSLSRSDLAFRENTLLTLLLLVCRSSSTTPACISSVASVMASAATTAAASRLSCAPSPTARQALTTHSVLFFVCLAGMVHVQHPAPPSKLAHRLQVDGFPPKEVVKTVFVEHDIQGDLGELNLVDYVQVQQRSPFSQTLFMFKNPLSSSMPGSQLHVLSRLCMCPSLCWTMMLTTLLYVC
jgi:hypothetical protein